jgi:hypothetical protein
MNKKPSFPPLSPEAERLDELLDEALIETFPASDPIAINIERIDRRPAERMLPKLEADEMPLHEHDLSLKGAA